MRGKERVGRRLGRIKQEGTERQRVREKGKGEERLVLKGQGGRRTGREGNIPSNIKVHPPS